MMSNKQTRKINKKVRDKQRRLAIIQKTRTRMEAYNDLSLSYKSTRRNEDLHSMEEEESEREFFWFL